MFKEDNNLAHMQNDASSNLEVHLILILFVLIAQISVLFVLHPPIAHAATKDSSLPQFSYSCVNPHCYGVNDWPGSIGGAFTVISVVHLQPGDDFVDNEMWTVDNNMQCQVESGGGYVPCDVEAGYVFHSGGAETWFWVDVRPNGGYYHEHDSPALNSGDYGNSADVTISQNGNAGQWSVSIQGRATSYSGVSTSNPIALNLIQIGQELGGTGGANAPKAIFQDNQWESVSGAWSYQTVDGRIDSYGNPHNPPWAGWDQGHDPVHYGYGGILYTCSLPSSGSNPC